MQFSSKLAARGTVLLGALAALAALLSALAVDANAATPQRGKPRAGSHSHTHAKTWFVSAHSRGRATGTRASPYPTIARAVARADDGDTVIVGRGTYREDVTIGKDITVRGTDHPTVDARGLDNGFKIEGKGADGATVRGFTVRNAVQEGVLAHDVSRVTIQDNSVLDNDTGLGAARPVGFCAPMSFGPPDCGEGVHLESVMHSSVLGNTVRGNAGGILVSDETGPTAFNTLARNTVTHNASFCGITLAGHNTRAVTIAGTRDAPVAGPLTPKLGGVYSNVVRDNVSNANGLNAGGGGFLIAAGAPGSGVYRNTVEDNRASENGFAGVVLHSHSPAQAFDGNQILRNTLSHNGVRGFPDGSPGDPDAGFRATVDITLFSAVTPLRGTRVSGNKLSNAHFGIWTQNVPPISPSANHADKTVEVPLFQK